MRKFNKDHIYSTLNQLDITIDQTGTKSMIRERGQDKATMRQGYRIRASGKTIGFGDWTLSECELLLETIKREHYAHLAYKELYYELIGKLASIGLQLIDDEKD